jgi:hypothetical protein
MKHYRAKSFIKAYNSLSPEIRKLADKNYQLLRGNPNHPTLNFKNVKWKKREGKPVYSARVGPRHRALAIEADPNVFIWFWIGTHEKYNNVLNTALDPGRGKHKKHS